MTREHARGRARAQDEADQIVFRWDGDNASGNTGFGPVAWSGDQEEAEALFQSAGAVLRASGEEVRPALVRLEGRGEVVLIRRTPWTDPGGGSSTLCHALIGSRDLLDPARCLGLHTWTWDGADLPLARVRGELSVVRKQALFPAVERGLRTLDARLAGAERELAGAVAELLRWPQGNFTFLDRRGDTALPVLWGLYSLFGRLTDRRWSFATHDTAELPAIRYVFVGRWAGAASRNTDRHRADPSERSGDEAESLAGRLVAHHLRLMGAGGDRKGVVGAELGHSLAGPGAPLRDTVRAALARLDRRFPPERPAPPAQGARTSGTSGPSGQPGRPERSERQERPEKWERPERQEKPERPDQGEASRRSGRPVWSEGLEWSDPPEPKPRQEEPERPGTPKGDERRGWWREPEEPVRPEPSRPSDGPARPAPVEPAERPDRPGTPERPAPATQPQQQPKPQPQPKPQSHAPSPARTPSPPLPPAGPETPQTPERPVRPDSARNREGLAWGEPPGAAVPAPEDTTRPGPVPPSPPPPDPAPAAPPAAPPWGPASSEPPAPRRDAAPEPPDRPAWAGPGDARRGFRAKRRRSARQSSGSGVWLSRARTAEEARDAAREAADSELLAALRDRTFPYAVMTALVQEIAGRYPSWGAGLRGELLELVIAEEYFVARSHPRDLVGPAERAVDAAALHDWAVRPLLGGRNPGAVPADRIAGVLARLWASPEPAAQGVFRGIVERPGLPESVLRALVLDLPRPAVPRAAPAPRVPAQPTASPAPPSLPPVSPPPAPPAPADPPPVPRSLPAQPAAPTDTLALRPVTPRSVTSAPPTPPVVPQRAAPPRAVPPAPASLPAPRRDDTGAPVPRPAPEPQRPSETRSPESRVSEARSPEPQSSEARLSEPRESAPRPSPPQPPDAPPVEHAKHGQLAVIVLLGVAALLITVLVAILV
ncbi:hypothetical protein ACFVQ4_33450 [Streptomyces laurentii]|uniref:hypothetical protein n=1 Tax=Streptomyces laurentii TaxID=39478 RepID=UPI0036A4AEAB